MVAQLLTDFLPAPWLAHLQLGTMERVNAKLHADQGDRRDGDIVWRIPMSGGGDSYLLLLLEFQSTPQRWMALRMMVYVGLLWQHLVREKRLAPDGRLPPVLPIVLYNGDPRWGMPLALRDLIGLPADSPFWQWQPDMRYHIIDEGAYPTDQLADRDSLAALLFRLEHCHEQAEIVPLIDSVISWFRRHPGFEPLTSAFAMLAGRVMALQDCATVDVRVSENLLEVRTMLATRVEEWKKQWQQAAMEEGRSAGLERGRQEGRLEGRREGEASLLSRQLQRRFGALPDWVLDKLTGADQSSIENWGLRLLDAKTLEEIFL